MEEFPAENPFCRFNGFHAEFCYVFDSVHVHMLKPFQYHRLTVIPLFDGPDFSPFLYTEVKSPSFRTGDTFFSFQ